MLGVNNVTVRQVGSELITMGLISIIDGEPYPTPKLIRAFMFEDEGEEAELVPVDDFSNDVIDFFNQINGTRMKGETYASAIKAILRADKTLELKHFEAVIKHKAETWGKDAKMQQHNRPGTIFRSAKQFLRYLDDARVWWDNKSKQELMFAKQ